MFDIRIPDYPQPPKSYDWAYILVEYSQLPGLQHPCVLQPQFLRTRLSSRTVRSKHTEHLQPKRQLPLHILPLPRKQRLQI